MTDSKPEPITLVAQISPQRSTQYASMANTLAPYELRLSPLVNKDQPIEEINIGKQPFVKFDWEPDIPQGAIEFIETGVSTEMENMATLSAFFYYYNQINGEKGPFLKPIESSLAQTHPRAVVQLPWTLTTSRRYRGKTNEMFTHFMCNVARYSSNFSTQPWSSLQVLDPLAGGGTTLLTALALGADAAGIEQNQQDVQSTATFLTQFLQEERISHRVDKANLKKGQLKQAACRWHFEIGKKPKKSSGAANPNSIGLQHCIVSSGDTVDLKILLPTVRPHLIITDLPYGIQHHGVLIQLLENALPIWQDVLHRGGVMVFSWDATRFSRKEMISVVQNACSLTVLNESPYDTLAHPVDRVIKQRDVIVAKKV